MSDYTREEVIEKVKKGEHLNRANLRGVDLSQANLSGAILVGADLSCAIMNYANLSFSNLVDAKLIGTKLNGAHLFGAKMWGADLTAAKLCEANMRETCLKGADMTGADMTWTSIMNADLSCAYMLNVTNYFGEITNTRPRQITTLEYDVLSWGNKIKIGCEIHTYEEWRYFTNREILEMNGKEALVFWKKYKSDILSLNKSIEHKGILKRAWNKYVNIISRREKINKNTVPYRYFSKDINNGK